MSASASIQTGTCYRPNYLETTTPSLWDTAALEEPESGTSGYMGGISLFPFCVRGNRVTTTMQSNYYRLFYEVLGKRRVPIALAVMHWHLGEREPVMEGWERNVKPETLEHNGIRIDGHACITTLEGHPEYVESRNVVQELLWWYADQGKFATASETWLGRLLSRLSALLGLRRDNTTDDIHTAIGSVC
ncbi:hypothetical protein OG21DRAFT_1498932 [Imleria badia]|nr:hypothetical protein OG21DRAFT_1498932 [Imleria badia]